jgi:hypothetical protein
MLGWRPNNHGVLFSIRFVERVESMGALAGVGTGQHIPSGYATCDGDWRAADITPDLSDPATLGCLLALVREAWSDPYLCAVGDPDTGWRVDAVTAQVQDLHGFSSEAEALVAALEAAP